MSHFATVANMTFHGFVLAKAATKTNSSTTTILFLVVIVGIGYFLLIRPQRQRARKTQQQGQNVDVGDEVMLTSGIFGHVTSMEGDRATVEIAPDIEIEVVTRAIAQRIAPSDDLPASELVAPDPAGDEGEDFAHASDDPSDDDDETQDSDHYGQPDDTDPDGTAEADDDRTAWPPTAVKPAGGDTGNSVPGGGIVGAEGSGKRRRSRRETS